ncbi:MAG TPA: alpha/beta fold hydrolase [Candidatus Saccharimonadales bacterium]|nr:alpha/beta fold hydrolase [Candidatus Saccharimonadales bacterium]
MDQLSGNTLDFVVGGFGAGEATHQPLCKLMEHVSGNPTFYIGSLRRGDCITLRRTSPFPLALDLQARHVASEISKAVQTFRAARPSPKDVEGQSLQGYNVRIYGHSFGAAASMLAAAAYLPNVPRSLFPLAPACFRKEGLRLVGRVLFKAVNDLRMARFHPNTDVRAVMALRGPGLREYASNLPRTLAEGWMLTRTDVYLALTDELARQKVPVRTAYAERDELFPELRKRPRNMENAIILEGVTHDVQYYHRTVVAQLAEHGML